jgi:DNA-binding transcriptional ArsR family regulator
LPAFVDPELTARQGQPVWLPETGAAFLRLDAASLECPTPDNPGLLIPALPNVEHILLDTAGRQHDLYLTLVGDGKDPVIPEAAILRKLDQHFYFNQWSATSDQQRMFMTIIAQLSTCEDEFAAQEITRLSKDYLDKAYSTSSVNQYLARLTDAGLIYKNRRGKYQFAVPLMSRFVNRQIEHDTRMPAQFRSSIVGRRPS